MESFVLRSVDDSTKVLTINSTPVSIHGLADATVIFGSCKIFGSVFTASNSLKRNFTLISSKSDSLTCISSFDDDSDFVNRVVDYEFDVEDAKMNRNCILLLKRKTKHMLQGKYFTYRHLFPRDDFIVVSDIDQAKQPALLVDENWEKTAGYITDYSEQRAPIVVVSGSKGVGKSTFCRYITNRLTEKCQKILYVDLDVGQPEFTPPGIVSIHLVDKTVIGSPFTHQSIDPESPRLLSAKYVGVLNIADASKAYRDSCMSLIDQALHINNSQGIPIILNTLGWIKGLGMDSLKSFVQSLQPTHSIFLSLPPNTKDYVSVESFYAELNTNECHNTLWWYLESASPSSSNYQAFDQRAFRWMSYFSYGNPDLHLDELVPLRVPFKDIVLGLADENTIPASDILRVFNCGLVALLKVDVNYTDAPIEYPRIVDNGKSLFGKDWIGYGFIRGIDLADRTFLLLTPIGQNELEHVNAFCKSSLELPFVMISPSKKQQLQSPYTEYTNTEGYGAAQRKVRHSLKRN